MLTQERLKELLKYDPETGLFTWISRKPKVKLNTIAGYKTKRGYILIGVDRVYYFGHRLAFFYMTGQWPKEVIDHINCIKSDN